MKESRDNFEGEVNDTILLVVENYWNVVQARENLVVQRESFDEAQKSYDHDKKSLELGALPPLDIYRSESQVASRRVSVIQAEYGLKQAEDQFRQVIGADVDPEYPRLRSRFNGEGRSLGRIDGDRYPHGARRGV